MSGADAASLLVTINGAAVTLLSGLWRASISGALFAAVVWVICRIAPRLPAGARFWLWWFVCAKFLLGLALNTSDLPILPPIVLQLPEQHPVAAPALFVSRLAARPALILQGVASHPSINKVKPSQDTQSATSAGEEELTADAGVTSAPRQALPHKPIFSPITAILPLFGIWTVGVLFWSIRRIRAARELNHTVQGALPAPVEIAQLAEMMAARSRLRQIPRVRLSQNTASPFVAGLLRPVVVLPASAESLSASELQMSLAHEFTHIRRRDLWLGIVPLAAEALFFFFPVARWAARECADCREEVCDAAAINATNGAMAGYGKLLLKIAAATSIEKPSLQSTAALGMAAPSTAFTQIRRRLLALQSAARNPISPRVRRLASLLVAISLSGLLPWRLRALPVPVEPRLDADASEAAPQYTVVDLGTLGGKFSEAYGLGEDGTVVGTANVYPLGGRGHAFVRDPDGKSLQDICSGSVFRHSLAYAVNTHGQIVAAAFNNALKPSSFLWSPDAPNQRRYMETLPGYRYTRAVGISDSSIVAGSALRSEPRSDGRIPMRAVIWAKGHIRDLGTLGGQYSAAMALNESGEIVGKADITNGSTHAFLWRADGMQDLGVLPGGQNSAASAVNRTGVAVGFSETADAPRHACLYESGSAQDLGTLPVEETDAVPVSMANAISDSGNIVGTSSYVINEGVRTHHAAPEERAVLWLPGGHGNHRLVDLNTRIPDDSEWMLETAHAVNERGEIVGAGRIHGKRHAYLLIPIHTEKIAGFPAE